MPSRWKVFLTLGRVSNLPTIWTNVWAGAALGGAHAGVAAMMLCMGAVSALYVAGMFLNDAFDRDIDRIERPERPIPAGWISARAVFSGGFGLLLLGIVGVTLTPLFNGVALTPMPFVSAAALSAAIVLYNARHKNNVAAPWIMGLCRGLVYVTSALALGGALSPTLGLAALSLAAYVVGLTFVARGEVNNQLAAHWPVALVFAPLLVLTWLLLSRDSPPAPWLALGLWLLWVRYCLSSLLRGKAPVMRGVVQLIAGISLLDAALACAFTGPVALLAGTLGTVSTLYLQRVARGT